MKINEALNIAAKEIGNTEYPPGTNNVKYNTWYYGHEVRDGYPNKSSTYPWCVAFVEWVLRNTGLLKRTASSTDLYESFKAKNAIVKTPQPGDIVFFYFSKKKRPGVIAEHVGIVESVSADGSIVSIEGNTSVSGSQDNGGMVCRKKHKSQIVGYGRPSYSDAAVTIPVNSKHPTLKVGSKGPEVLYLHSLLKGKGYGVNTSDSEFRQLTKQCVMHVQASNALEIDGICGPLTWAVLEK